MIVDAAEKLKSAMAQLPFITGDNPGIDGVLKAAPEHFQVEEILPYAPCGEGEHLFVKLRRSGWNTASVAQALGKCFGLRETDIGWGGRKDKYAVTTQTFSLRLPLSMSVDAAASALKDLPFEFIDLQRHGNKLKTGHVAANRFRIILSGIDTRGALDKATATCEDIRRTGIPNFYGEQRFGAALSNIDRAIDVLKRGKARGKKAGFMISVLQSALFNIWLVQRIQRGDFNRIIQGDLVKKTDTGGMFTIEDLDDGRQRFADRKIIYTGPIYGYKMRSAGDRAHTHEKALLDTFELAPAAFKSLRAPGTRRAGIIYMDDLTIGEKKEGLEFRFTLPSGAYATTVLREFTRRSEMGIGPNI